MTSAIHTSLHTFCRRSRPKCRWPKTTKHQLSPERLCLAGRLSPGDGCCPASTWTRTSFRRRDPAIFLPGEHDDQRRLYALPSTCLSWRRPSLPPQRQTTGYPSSSPPRSWMPPASTAPARRRRDPALPTLTLSMSAPLAIMSQTAAPLVRVMELWRFVNLVAVAVTLNFRHTLFHLLVDFSDQYILVNLVTATTPYSCLKVCMAYASRWLYANFSSVQAILSLRICRICY
jgi:hypothetical protein